MKRLPLALLASAFLAACAPPAAKTADHAPDDGPRPAASASTAAPAERVPAPVPTSETRPELARHFGGMPGTFVLLDARRNHEVRYDSARAEEGFLPASTFKIANSVVALETGVASGPDFAIRWDSVRDPRRPGRDAWYRDQTMRSAFAVSAVWYYQEIARRAGEVRMRDWLRRLDYGNADVSGGVDRFWLTGGLRISAAQQVDFLRRLYEGRLPVSPRTTAAVKEILVMEDSAGYRLSAKTGATSLPDGTMIAWLVGYVERDGGVQYFAMNLSGPEDAVFPGRVERAKGMLRELGVLPGG
jgi:beta-lactamase class D